MKIAITQPNYLPWLGYFALLDRIDLFVSLDNVQLVKRSFIVRNRVKRPDGEAAWLSLEVQKSDRSTLLRDARLASSGWAAEHLDRLAAYYRDAPCAARYLPRLQKILPPAAGETTVSLYNERLLVSLCELMGIEHRWIRASALVPDVSGTAQEKILALCHALGEPRLELYNFARGVEIGLYDGEVFRTEGIRLVKQAYEHPTYRQSGSSFLAYLSVVDLILNEGPAALEILRAGDRWEAVP